MSTISIQEAQNRLSELIHRLTPGQEVVITENDQPVARLVAAAPASESRKAPNWAPCEGPSCPWSISTTPSMISRSTSSETAARFAHADLGGRRFFKLGARAYSLFQDPAHDRLMSAATLWEIAIKLSLGKLPLSLPYRQWMDRAMTDLVLDVLPITLEHAERQASLPWHHRDPFDRLLVAQALVEDVPLLSADPALDAYGITRLW